MRGNPLFKALDRWLGIPLLAFFGLGRSRGPVAPLKRGGRVLLIKQSAMGDTLLLLPILKALREALGPDGELDLVCTSVNASVLKGLPWLSRLHRFEPGAFLARPWRLFGFIRGLRARRYDWALDLDQWLRSSALLAVLSGAAWRAGFRTAGQHKHAAFHASVPNGRGSHEFEQFKAVAALAGLDAAAVEPYAGFLLAMGFLGAAAAPRGARGLVLLHPGTGGARGWQREWPVERFAELGRDLKAQGYAVGLSGAGPYEAGLCAAIEQGMGGADERCIDGGLASLVQALCRCDLLVCGNTGVMHMAAGLGRPVLALHGPNPADKWGPLPLAEAPQRTRVLAAALPCSPCLSLGFEFGCSLRPCMESIRTEAVIAAARGLLKAHA